jgi:O-antigen/teichoic acid export membrane protein
MDPIRDNMQSSLSGEKPIIVKEATNWEENFSQPKSDQVKGTSLRGGLITLAGQGISFCTQTAYIMIMARLLTPADFGVNGMVLAITGFLAMFSDIGLGAATVQRKTITQEELSNLFWVNLLVGGLLTILTMLIAPALVFFYRDPRLFWVTIVVSLSFVINGAGVQHAALLMRSMRYTALTINGIVTLTLSSALGIGMAAAGCSYWSLVAMGLSSTFVRVVGYWIAIRWRPGWLVRECGIRSLLHFGGKITLNSLVSYVTYNAEKVLLGRFYGAESLGLYGRAYQLLNLPLQQLHVAMYAVAFPGLSAVQDNSERLCRFFLKGYSVLLALTIPIIIASALFAEEIVRILLGSKWIQAAPILQLLTPAILVFAMINPFGWFLVATGRARRSLRMAFVIAPTVILGILLGLHHGVKGVALGYSLAMCFLLIPMIVWAIHDTGMAAKDYWQAAHKPLLAGLLSGGCGFILKHFFAGAFSPVLFFIASMSVCIGLYAWILLIILRQKDFFLDLAKHVIHRS